MYTAIWRAQTTFLACDKIPTDTNIATKAKLKTDIILTNEAQNIHELWKTSKKELSISIRGPRAGREYHTSMSTLTSGTPCNL